MNEARIQARPPSASLASRSTAFPFVPRGRERVHDVHGKERLNLGLPDSELCPALHAAVSPEEDGICGALPVCAPRAALSIPVIS